MMKLKKQNDEPEIHAGTNDNDNDDVKFTKPNLKGDWMNIFLLLLLYTMQGIPMGISMAIPILLQSNKSITYNDQAMLSFSHYPFSLKILWAPIVDALYTQKFGRRKSWLVPTQYLIAATQDIAVDGWSLTMLKKNNVGYASICNATGQVIGILLGNMPVVLLTSEDFCNKYLRTMPVHGEGGILTLKTIISSCGLFFIVVTSLVAIFKREKDCTLEDNYTKVNILQSYTLLWYILKLPCVQTLAIVLLTVKIGFIPASVDIVPLKLIDAGVSKDIITFISSSLSGINILLPTAISKLISGPKTVNVFLRTIIFRLPMNVAFAILLYYTPSLLSKDSGTGQIPTYYFAILAVIFLIQNVIAYTMFVALQSFFSQISDARFGGTYMTLLNTLHNLGNDWTSTTALALLDVLTFKISTDSHDCYTADPQKTCDGNQGKHHFVVDGYYTEMLLCTVIGIVWYFIFRNKIKSFQTNRASDWLVNL